MLLLIVQSAYACGSEVFILSNIYSVSVTLAEGAKAVESEIVVNRYPLVSSLCPCRTRT